MYRIETRWLDDASIDDKVRATHVSLFAPTGATGGTEIDADGNIYASDLDQLSIRKITPDGRISTFIQDLRLLWVDAMWIDDAGGPWLPASQQNRTKSLNSGRVTLVPPTVIYRLESGARPFRN